MEGDGLVKELTGAKVMVMAEDEPMLRAMKPGGKEHPVDQVVHDDEAVTLGNTTRVAHLTPGHTRGATGLDHNGDGRRQDLQRGFLRQPPLTPPDLSRQ
jgi:metallo-beta-lactamase class B